MDKNRGVRIDLEEPAVPAVLAGLLDINVNMVYQARQDGKLPSDSATSFRECIQQYVNFYKNKAKTKLGEAGLLKVIQETRNLRATEELKYLEIKTKKEELVEVVILIEVLQPIFNTVSEGMIAISRNHPETDKEIRNLLKTWNSLGEILAEKAENELKDLVQTKLQEDLGINLQLEEEDLSDA